LATLYCGISASRVFQLHEHVTYSRGQDSDTFEAELGEIRAANTSVKRYSCRTDNQAQSYSSSEWHLETLGVSHLVPVGVCSCFWLSELENGANGNCIDSVFYGPICAGPSRGADNH